jgi:hypothetical protein
MVSLLKTASGASQDITDYGDWKIQNLIAKYKSY